MEKGSLGVSNKIGPLAYDELSQVLQEVQGCRAKTAIFCDSSKNCEKLKKSQFLLRLIKPSVTGGRRVSSKNCDFCNFYDFSKNCKKMGEIAVFAKIN